MLFNSGASYPGSNDSNDPVRCSHCNSDQVVYLGREDYCDAQGDNPCIWRCKSCGKEFTIFQ